MLPEEHYATQACASPHQPQGGTGTPTPSMSTEAREPWESKAPSSSVLMAICPTKGKLRKLRSHGQSLSRFCWQYMGSPRDNFLQWSSICAQRNNIVFPLNSIDLKLSEKEKWHPALPLGLSLTPCIVEWKKRDFAFWHFKDTLYMSLIILLFYNFKYLIQEFYFIFQLQLTFNITGTWH